MCMCAPYIRMYNISVCMYEHNMMVNVFINGGEGGGGGSLLYNHYKLCTL